MESRLRILGVVAAWCAALAVVPGFAQENAPTTDGNVSRASGGAVGAPEFTTNGVDPVRPESGSAGLQRRANLKALIASAPKMATGSPASGTRTGPPLVRPGVDGAGARNAIGAVMPGGQTSSYSPPGFTVQTRSGVTATGTPGRNVGDVNLRRGPVSPNAGQTPQAAGLNGTTIGHVGSGLGSIGGPAKNHSGINGTFLRPNR
jgi:hypothetical protein